VSEKYILKQLNTDPGRQLSTKEEIKKYREELFKDCEEAYKGVANMIREMDDQYYTKISSPLTGN